MARDHRQTLEERVVDAAGAALADHGYVNAIDVLTGMRFLHPGHVESWRKGRLDFLRSEEHTSELQSLRHLVCRLLLEKKKNTNTNARPCCTSEQHRAPRSTVRRAAVVCAVRPPRLSILLRFVVAIVLFVFFFLMIGRPPRSTLFPYTPLFR